MVRVCHMTSVHTRYDIRIFQKECVSLAEAGFEVYLVVNDVYADEVKNAIHIRSTSYQAKSRMERMLHAARKVYQTALQIDADIYHFHDPELLPYGYKLKKKGYKVVFDSHEFIWKQMECRDYLPKAFRKIASWLYRKCEGYVVGKIDAVIVPCTYDGKSYFGDKCKREVLVNNYPRLEEMDKEEICFCDRKRQACYIGGLTEQRGAVIMARACLKTGIPLALAGRFSSDELKREVLEASPDIVYKGNLQRLGVKKLLGESFMGICVLQDEGQYRHLDNLPTKVYEYMGAGMPVIISDFPYYKKMIQRYQCGRCVCPDHADDIAAHMEWLLSHPMEAEEMGRNGRRAVMQEFNWKAEEKKLLRLYDELRQELMTEMC